MMFPTKMKGLMKTGLYTREPFDPHRTYTATKTMVCRGKRIDAGAIFDKTLVNTRRLRQMYEHRMLQMAPYEEPLPQAVEQMPPEKPDFLGLSNEGLKIWLRNHSGYIARPRTHRSRLLELCEQKWQEYIDVLTTSERNSESSSKGVSRKTTNGSTEKGNSDDS